MERGSVSSLHLSMDPPTIDEVRYVMSALEERLLAEFDGRTRRRAAQCPACPLTKKVRRQSMSANEPKALPERRG
jgi:hypothetical protein